MFDRLKKKIRAVIREESARAIRDVIKGTAADKRVFNQQMGKLLDANADAVQAAVDDNADKIIKALDDSAKEMTKAMDAHEARCESRSKANAPGKRDNAAAWAAHFGDYTKNASAALKSDNMEALLDELKKLALEKKRCNAAALKQAEIIRNMLIEKGDKEKYRDAQRILFDMHTATEFGVSQLVDVGTYRFSLSQANSLRLQYVRRRRMKQLGHVPDRWITRTKENGHRFAAMCGLEPLPTQHWPSFDDIPLPEAFPVVIKPLRGSDANGVYIVNAMDDIYSFSNYTTFRSWDDVRRNIEQTGEAVSTDFLGGEYLTQKAICIGGDPLRPAHDYKFYSFYGDIKMVLEVARHPEWECWWYTSDGERITDLKCEYPVEHSLGAPTQEQLETARQLSLKIPAPFMRLDFLTDGENMFFDEFTSTSAGGLPSILEYWSPKYDARFGIQYLAAEIRLQNDLLEGKTFPEIMELNRICDARFEAEKMANKR